MEPPPLLDDPDLNRIEPSISWRASTHGRRPAGMRQPSGALKLILPGRTSFQSIQAASGTRRASQGHYGQQFYRNSFPRRHKVLCGRGNFLVSRISMKCGFPKVFTTISKSCKGLTALHWKLCRQNPAGKTEKTLDTRRRTLCTP